jgi:uncharacterized protein
MERLLHLLLILIFFGSSFGQIPTKKSPARFLNNFSNTNILSPAEQALIEERLDQFEQETSNEITIVIIDDLGGDEPWHFATELGEAWGVGKANLDNGLVFLIKPTQENGGRQVYLAPGRGLEAAITDLTCQDIVHYEILPPFKQNQYAQGINKALDVLFALAKGEINEKSYRNQLHQNDWVKGIFGFIFIIVLLFWIIKRGGGGGNGTTFGGRRSGPGFFYFGGFGGGFGSGGSSSGGFGGFGGGSFGGGGSGGSW